MRSAIKDRIRFTRHDGAGPALDKVTHVKRLPDGALRRTSQRAASPRSRLYRLVVGEEGCSASRIRPAVKYIGNEYPTTSYNAIHLRSFFIYLDGGGIFILRERTGVVIGRPTDNHYKVRKCDGSRDSENVH